MTELALSVREFVPEVEEALSFREDGPRLYVAGLVVPYMRPTEVTEWRGGHPLHFREQFAPGALERLRRAPTRYPLQYGHTDGLTERLGSGFLAEERDEGLWLEWMIDRARYDIARDVIETSHRALSIGFVPLHPAPLTEREGALVTRRSVIPRHVAVVPVGAYPEALVGAMAVRGEVEGEKTDADRAEEERAAKEAELLAWVDEAVATQRELERPSV